MSIFKKSFFTFLHLLFYIQRVKAGAKPCPRQLPIRGGNTVSAAKAILPPVVPPAAFLTEQDIVLCIDVSVSCYFFATASQIFKAVLKAFAFDR